jgi:hypothetical protein
MPKKGQRRRNASAGGRFMNPMGLRESTRSWNTLAEQTPALTRVQRFDNKPYKLCQLVDVGSILTSSAGGATFFGTAFTFSQIPQATSLAAIFDQYRIDEVEVWITPTLSAGATATSLLYSAVDYDTSVTPGSIGQLQQYQNVMETSATTGHYRRWRPHVGTAVGIPNTTVQGMANVQSPWIDSLTAGVNHNGLVIAMPATATTVTLNLRVRFTISVRNVF